MKKPHWVILGPEKSWETAFKQGGIWGVKEILYPEWKALERGDIIFFYVTKTIRGIIGVGKFETKFIQDRPLWPDEIAANKVIYPFGFEFYIDYLIEKKDWRDKKISIALSIQEMRRGINLLQDRTIEKLYTTFKERLNYIILPSEKEMIDIISSKVMKTEQVSLTHTQIQKLIFEIGQLNRFVAEKEYPMESERLDVVWRRVEKSVPTYVFEIQVEGDIYHALGKLKHAFDLWNSNIFLIIRDEDSEKAKALLSGTFHEIRDRAKIVVFQKIYELYQQKRRWIDIEKEIGLL